MSTIPAGRWWTVEFAEDGTVVDPRAVPGPPGTDGLRDVFVFAHGWNDSASTARDLAADLFERVHRLLDPGREATTGFVTLVWPSMLFPDDVPGTASTASAASAASAPTPTGPDVGAALAAAFPDRPATVRSIADALDRRPADEAAVARCTAQILSLASTADLRLSTEDAGSDALIAAPPLDAAQQATALSRAGATVAAVPTEGPQVASLWDGALEVARTLSYYAMKARAGDIGARGLAPLLRSLGDRGRRVHLAGHSFGARLVSFALTGLDAATSPVASLVLVQAAFSHFAFCPGAPAPRPGALAGVVDRVHGPLVSTFTGNDRACGWWYPTASMLARQDVSAVEDALYEWGALGHDGHQGVDVVDLRIGAPGVSYGLTAGHPTRVEASAVIRENLSWISGAHSDIRHDEIAWLMVDAAGLGK